MLKFVTLTAICASTLAVMSVPASAHDNGGAIAAGVIGGVAVGAIVGSQANGGYYGPGYYGGPTYQPVYSNCRIEREQVVDQYGRYRTRRIRVCD